MSEIPKQYDPQATEGKWFSFWERRGYFNADPDPHKPPHTIMIPLPNVTGALHMGHALNCTCQDLITRWRRMQGYEALWMPGTDHAGIATQAVVERRMLEEEGLTRHDVGREALVNRIWRWKDAYEKKIIGQLKTLGASCDWRRVRFTLDEVCARAVRRTFFKMFKDGLIYRGKRLVNWDVHLQTAVADDEVFEDEIDGHFWTFNYPVVDESGKPTNEVIRFSTTRPETMLGDTAVCVHPTDERYQHLIGKRVQIPVSIRQPIPIIADGQLADKELGTGAVKVTPAHDPNDYACYQRKLGQPDQIEAINILNPNGTLNEHGGEWQGLDRLEARTHVIERMAELGRFDAVEDRKIPLKHSDRSKTPVEPYLSDQWFVKMGDFIDSQGNARKLAQSAIDVVEDGRVRFFPSRYAKTYTDWLGEKRDWCISRQLWWGHRIPIWSRRFDLNGPANVYNELARELIEGLSQTHVPEDEDLVRKLAERIHGLGQHSFVDTGSDGLGQVLSDQFGDSVATQYSITTQTNDITILVAVADGHPAIERVLQDIGFVQDPDVLDTWFSSALWPHATLGWPDFEHNPPLNEEELAKQSDARPAASLKDVLERCGYREISLDEESKLAEAARHLLDKKQSLPTEIEDALRKSLADAACSEHSTHRETDVSRSPRALNSKSTSVVQSEPSTFNLQPSTNNVLNYFYPGSVLITSRDIITLWVARMVLTGLYNMGDVPFHHVHVHPKILDGFGQTMSKSKGNGVDPVDLIDKYGTDAVRFTIASFAGETQDVRLPISYECPKCETLIPQTLKHQTAKPEGGPKPTVHCPKCNADYQYTSPNYDPDQEAPVARMVSERFEYGRNFCNKFWNAARFAMLNLERYTPAEVTADQLQLEDRWILSRLSTVANEVTEYLGRYQFDAATRAVRDFTWNEFCDWYLEMIKPRLRPESRVQSPESRAGSPATAVAGSLADAACSETRAVAQRVLLSVLDSLVRLLQPFTPFLSEELWQRLREIAPERALPEKMISASGGRQSPDSRTNVEHPTAGPHRPLAILTPQSVADAAIIAKWPQIPESWQDTVLEKRFERLQEIIVAVRNVRAIYNIPPGTPVKLLMRATPEVAGDMQSVSAQFDNLAKAVLEAAGAEVERPSGSASFSLGDADGYIPLAGLIDTHAELERQQKEAEKIRKHIAGHEAKLRNDSFVSKAPEHVVAQVRETLEGLRKQLQSLEEVIADLS